MHLLHTDQDHDSSVYASLPAIHVIISGQAETEWKEREKKEVNGSTKKTTETYKGKRVYFEQLLPLIGQLSPNEFSAGTHTFPFSYELAHSLPPSLKGVHGSCTYTAKAILDRPWRPNEAIKKEFTVATRHLYSMAMLSPAYEETLEELWSLPFKTSPFSLHVEVAQQAFRVGDGIPVSVQLEHESNVSIHEVKFQLRQVLSFYSQQPQRRCKTEQNKIVDIRCKVMDSRKVGKFQRVLQIPHLPVTYVTHSELTGVAYEVRVEVKLGGLNKNPIVRIPVVIGTGLSGGGVDGQLQHNMSIGFDAMLGMSPGGGGGAHRMMMMNASQMSSISGSTTTMSQGSVSLLETSSASTATATSGGVGGGGGAGASSFMEQGSAPPAYYEVVTAAGAMMKH